MIDEVYVCMSCLREAFPEYFEAMEKARKFAASVAQSGRAAGLYPVDAGSNPAAGLGEVNR